MAFGLDRTLFQGGIRHLDAVLTPRPASPHRYMMTNTRKPLARPLVEALGIGRWVHDMRYPTRKPDGLRQWLPELFATHAVDPTAALCDVGNLRNDSHPATESGLQAVWIDPYAALQVARPRGASGRGWPGPAPSVHAAVTRACARAYAPAVQPGTPCTAPPGNAEALPIHSPRIGVA